MFDKLPPLSYYINMKKFFFFMFLFFILFNSLLAINSEFQKELSCSVSMISSGKFAQAESTLKRLAYISTDRTVLLSSYFWLGYIQYRKGNYNNAVCDFNNSMHFATNRYNSSIISLWLAKSYYQVNSLDSSETYFNRISNNIPIVGFRDEYLFYKSLLKFKESEIDSALSILSKVLNKPQSGWVLENLYYSYSYLYRFKHSLHSSESLIDSLLKNDRTNKLFLLKGYFEMEDSNYTSAESSLNKSLSGKYPLFSKYSYTLLIWDLVFQNKFYEVTKLYNDTLNIPDYDESILFLYGYSLEKIHNYKRAIKVFNNLIEDYPQSRYVPYAIFFKGLSLLNTKKYNRALLLFENFEISFPKYHNLYYYSRYYHAYTLYKLNNFRKAIEIFNSILSDKPAFPEYDRVYYMIAKCYQNLKQYKIAIKNYTVVTDSFPNSTNYEYAKYNIAISNYLLKKYRIAYKQFDSLCSGNKLPTDVNEEIYFYREKCKFKMGKYKNIIEMAESFVKKYPNFNYSKELISEIDLYYRSKDRFKKLLNFYGYIVDSTSSIPEKPNYIRTLAGIYSEIGNYQMALNYYEKIEDKTFEDQLNISDFLIKLKRFNEAIQMLRSMLKSYTSLDNSNKILFNISRCYTGIGQFSESEKILNSIIDSYSKTPPDSFYIETVVALSDLYAKNGKISDAESLLAKTAENRHFMEYLLYTKLADLLYSEDSYEEAVKTAKIASKFINRDTDKLAKLYYFIAKCDIQLGRIDEALQKLDEAELLTKNQSTINKIIILREQIKKGKL